MSHEISAHLARNFQQSQTRDSRQLSLDELVELFKLAKQLVGLSLEIGDRLRKLALQQQDQQSRESL